MSTNVSFFSNSAEYASFSCAFWAAYTPVLEPGRGRQGCRHLVAGCAGLRRSLDRAQLAVPGCGCRCSVALCSPAETHGAVRGRNTHEPPGATRSPEYVRSRSRGKQTMVRRTRETSQWSGVCRNKSETRQRRKNRGKISLARFRWPQKCVNIKIQLPMLR